MAWKELRLPVAEAQAQIRRRGLTLEQQGRLGLAWMAVWILGEAVEEAWRLELGYSAAEWAGVRESYADVLQRDDGSWSLPFMLRERDRQEAERVRQADLGRRGGLAKASHRQAQPSDRLAKASGGYDSLGPASASASEPTPSRSLRSRNGVAKADPAYTPEFEAFWEGYRCERRRGKPQAFREYLACGGTRIHAQVMTALEAYKAGREWREGFMPEPERWLKKRPWDGPVAQEEAPW